MKNQKKGFFSTIGRWFRRFFFGASKETSSMDVEEIVSPSRQVFRNFMERKLAVGSAIVVILMFLLAFIGPLFVPLDLNYTEPTQMNLSPGMNMMNVPKELAKDVKKKGEGAKVAIRNIRRDANDTFKKMEKADEISEDDLKDATEKIQKITDKAIEKVEKAVENKTKEILTV